MARPDCYSDETFLALDAKRKDDGCGVAGKTLELIAKLTYGSTLHEMHRCFLPGTESQMFAPMSDL